MKGDSLLCFAWTAIFSFALWIPGAAGESGQRPEKLGLATLDLAADKRLTLCSLEKKPMSCETPGSSIAITGVFWGRTSPDICPSEDGDPVLDCETAPETEQIVREMCEGTGSCFIEGKASLLQKGKHCFGVQKYLLVNYTCVPKVKEAVLCDGEKSLLSCPSDWVIKVASAFWGRESTNVCPSERGQVTCPGASETVSKLRSKCNSNPYCPVQAYFKDLQNGGENCPRVNKYLVVQYGCQPSSSVGRREELGRIPLSLYRKLRLRSRIWHVNDVLKRSNIMKKPRRAGKNFKHPKISADD